MCGPVGYTDTRIANGDDNDDIRGAHRPHGDGGSNDHADILRITVVVVRIRRVDGLGCAWIQPTACGKARVWPVYII